MGYSATVDLERKLVRIEHFDDMREEEMYAGREQAGSLLKQHGFSHLLIDARQILDPPETMVTFSITTSHNNVLPPGFRLALVVAPEMMNEALFSENVAVNRGFSYKVFLDEGEAITWLKQS